MQGLGTFLGLLLLLCCACRQHSGPEIREVTGRPLEVLTPVGPLSISALTNASQINPQFTEFTLLSTGGVLKLGAVAKDGSAKFITFLSKGQQVNVIVLSNGVSVYKGRVEKSYTDLKVVP